MDRHGLEKLADDCAEEPMECSSPANSDRPVAADLCALIAARRSVAPKRLVAPGPSADELEAIVALALTAPDHCALRPWRYVLVEKKSRELLGALFAQEKEEHDPSASVEDIDKERSRALNAPTLLAVILRSTPNHAKVPVSEQLISLGGSVQNLLLAAHAYGYAAMITSGRKIASTLLQEAFCDSPTDQLVGFISIGTPSRLPNERAEAKLAEHFQVWSPKF